jgi:phage protein U
MPDHLLAIGMFIFGLPRTAYDEMERSAAWRWGDSERFGVRAAGQFLGPGEEKITLNGVLVPEIAGAYSDITTLKEMAATGELHTVTLGTGEVLGDYRIDSVDEGWRNIIGGGLARSIDFTVELTRMDA